MQRHVFGDLQIDVDDESPPRAIRLDWRGKSNHRQPEAVLGPFFTDITKKALASGRALEMHFEALEFFNSSTITSIIQHLRNLRKQRVPLVVLFDAEHRWQRIFFDAISVLDRGDGLFTIRAASPPSTR